MYTQSTKHTSHYKQSRKEDAKATSPTVNRVAMPSVHEKRSPKPVKNSTLFVGNDKPGDFYQTTNSMTFLGSEGSSPSSPSYKSPSNSPTLKYKKTISPTSPQNGIYSHSTYRFGSDASVPTSTVRSHYQAPSNVMYQQYHHSPHVSNRKSIKKRGTQHHSPNQSEYKRLYRCDSREWRGDLKSSTQVNFTPPKHTTTKKTPKYQGNNAFADPSMKAAGFRPAASPMDEANTPTKSFILGDDPVDMSRRPTGVPYIPPDVIVPFQKIHPIVSSVHLGHDDANTIPESMTATNTSYGNCSPEARIKVYHDTQHALDHTGLEKNRKFYSSLNLGSDQVVMKSTSNTSYKPFSFSSLD